MMIDEVMIDLVVVGENNYLGFPFTFKKGATDPPLREGFKYYLDLCVVY